jgi:hypothetical protein
MLSTLPHVASPPLQPGLPKEQREICARLVKLQRKLDDSEIASEIAGLKDKLRDYVATTGKGFVEEVDGLGSVEARTGAEAELKGVTPVLQVDIYLQAPPAQRKRIEARGFVAWKEIWSSARKPSITVR